MINVRVKPFFGIKEIIGRTSLELQVEEGTTIKGLLDQLIENSRPALKKALIDPETNNLYSFYRIIVTGRDTNYLPEGLNTLLREGDVVSILQAAVGG